jgi:hypothetical protein
MMAIRFPLYDEHRGADRIAEHVTLKKGDRTARCTVRTHPLGLGTPLGRHLLG